MKFPLFPSSLLLYPDDGVGGGGLGDVSDFGQDLEDLGGIVVDNEELDDEGVDDENEEEGEEKKPKKSKDKEDESGDDDDEGEEEDDDQEDDDEEESKDEKPKDKKKDGEEDEEEEEGKEKPARIDGRPTARQLKEVLGKDVFKKVPYLREAVFQYPRYQEILPTPEDAQDAVTKSGFYDEIDESIRRGEPEVFLKAIKEGNPEAFKVYAGKITQTLRTIDEDTYFNSVAKPVVSELLFHAAAYAKKLGDVNLERAAKHVANYIFQNGGEIPDISKPAEKHPAEVELERVREETAKREYKGASSDVNVRIDRSLKGFITEGLSSRLSPIEREFIVERTLDKMVEKLSADQTHGLRMRQLWRKARTSGYDERSKVAIVTAHVARAKTLAREIRDGLVKEALKGRGGRPNQTGQKEQENLSRPRKRTFDSVGRGGGSGRRQTVLDSSKIDYKRTTDMDILMDDGGDKVKLKGQR